jgi:hypothetical protein
VRSGRAVACLTTLIQRNDKVKTSVLSKGAGAETTTGTAVNDATSSRLQKDLLTAIPQLHAASPSGSLRRHSCTWHWWQVRILVRWGPATLSALAATRASFTVLRCACPNSHHEGLVRSATERLQGDRLAGPPTFVPAAGQQKLETHLSCKLFRMRLRAEAQSSVVCVTKKGAVEGRTTSAFASSTKNTVPSVHKPPAEALWTLSIRREEHGEECQKSRTPKLVMGRRDIFNGGQLSGKCSLARICVSAAAQGSAPSANLPGRVAHLAALVWARRGPLIDP